MKKQLIFKYYTPKKGKKLITLMRFHEWITVYQNEVLIAHQSHEQLLLQNGFVECKGVKVYKTIKEALKGKNNFYIRPTE